LRLPRGCREDEIEQDREQAAAADQAHGKAPDPSQRLARRGLQDERRAAHHKKAKPDGHPAEQDELGHFPGGEPPARVETVADRAAAQAGKADAVTERKADEGGERDTRIGQAVADIAQAEPVKGGEAEIAAGGEDDREQEVASRDGSYRGDEIVEIVTAQPAIDQVSGEQRADEHEAAQQQRAPAPLLVAR